MFFWRCLFLPCTRHHVQTKDIFVRPSFLITENDILVRQPTTWHKVFLKTICLSSDQWRFFSKTPSLCSFIRMGTGKSFNQSCTLKKNKLPTDPYNSVLPYTHTPSDAFVVIICFFSLLWLMCSLNLFCSDSRQTMRFEHTRSPNSNLLFLLHSYFQGNFDFSFAVCKAAIITIIPNKYDKYQLT